MPFSTIPNTLHRYLVTHPTISNFEWSPPQTPLSSLPFLVAALLAYLSLALLLSLSPPSFSLPPRAFHLVSSLHNSTLLLLSFVMALSASLSSLHSLPSPSHLFCFPPLSTPASGPLFFWAYVFYLSKLYELLDTLLILVNPRRRPLTFLHVYHHSLVVVMCYVWLCARQSLMPVGLVTNASVHVVMYAYYLSSSLGWRWPATWKRALTRVQIWQFVVSFGLSLVFLWMHFFGDGCEGMKGWLFNAGFNASLLVLFLDFHATAYGDKGRKREKTQKRDE